MENQLLLRGKEIGAGFWEAVCSYQWPGNVRELLNILKRAGIMLESPITGEKISSLLCMNTRNKESQLIKQEKGDQMIKEIREKLNTGQSFWQLIWKPFIDRELDRNTVKRILKHFYTESAYNFRQMIGSLNMDTSDYPKFMSLIYKYKIDPRK
jgi:DNA-binding NtrC family response regulator